MSQIIYILANSHMPKLALMGYFDVGNLEKEMQRLYSEGVPASFYCEYAAEVTDAEKTEKEVRQKFVSDFVSHERGFFKKESIEPIKVVIKKYEIKDVTPDSQIDRNFDFYKVGIEKGERVIFIKDKDIICSVYNNKKVEFRGRVMSFSDATMLAYREIDQPTKTESYRGSDHWNYKGKRLIKLWNDYKSNKGK